MRDPRTGAAGHIVHVVLLTYSIMSGTNGARAEIDCFGRV